MIQDTLPHINRLEAQNSEPFEQALSGKPGVSGNVADTLIDDLSSIRAVDGTVARLLYAMDEQGAINSDLLIALGEKRYSDADLVRISAEYGRATAGTERDRPHGYTGPMRDSLLEQVQAAVKAPENQTATRWQPLISLEGRLWDLEMTKSVEVSSGKIEFARGNTPELREQFLKRKIHGDFIEQIRQKLPDLDVGIVEGSPFECPREMNPSKMARLMILRRDQVERPLFFLYGSGDPFLVGKNETYEELLQQLTDAYPDAGKSK